MKRILILLFFMATFSFNLKAHTVDNPVIFNFNETIRPGETISLQGHNFGTMPTVWLMLVKSNAKALQPALKLPINSSSTLFAAATIPPTIPFGLYAVWVENDGKLSKPILINKARVNTTEFYEIMPGTTFRLFGRNLIFNQAKTTVTFIPEGNDASLSINAVGTSPYELKLTAPKNLVAGTKYHLKISNGYGGQHGETIFNKAISVRQPTADPLELNVPWAGDFDYAANVYNVKTDGRLKIKAKGDGIANDREALQEAIDLAAIKGGIIYLPVGSYKLMYESGSGITMRSRVILKGDGLDKTKITYGYGKPFGTERVKAAYGWTLGWPDSRAEGMAMIFPGGIHTSGLINLTFQNVNETGNFLHTIKDMPEGGSKLIFKDCNFDFNTGWGMAMVNVEQLLITGCTFKSTTQDVRNINAPTRTWPWDLKNSSHLIFSNNKHFYTAGRFGANGVHHAIFEKNIFLRDGNHQAKGETGGLSLDYVSNVIVQDNIFDVDGESVKNANQGETILTQGGNAHQQNVGIVSHANATSITDTKKEFQDLTDRVSTDWQYAVHPTNYSLVIVSGTGTGQWRTITGNNDTTLTIDKPWDIIPEKDTKYVITQWSAQQLLIKNNILKGNNRGIWFYSGGSDVVIADNTLNNSEGIYIRSDQRLSINRFNLTWNILITNNVVMNSDGRRPAYIAIWLAKNKAEPLFGTGTIGVEIRNNKIEAFTPNVTFAPLIKGEGYFNSGTEADAKLKNTPVGILGTLFENNKAIYTEKAYVIGTISENTIVIEPKKP